MCLSQSKRMTTVFDVTLTLSFLRHYLEHGHTITKKGYRKVLPYNKTPVSEQKVSSYLFSNHTIVYIHNKQLTNHILYILSFFRDKEISDTIYTLSHISTFNLTEFDLYILSKNTKTTKKESKNLSSSDKFLNSIVKNKLKGGN